MFSFHTSGCKNRPVLHLVPGSGYTPCKCKYCIYCDNCKNCYNSMPMRVSEGWRLANGAFFALAQVLFSQFLQFQGGYKFRSDLTCFTVLLFQSQIHFGLGIVMTSMSTAKTQLGIGSRCHVARSNTGDREWIIARNDGPVNRSSKAVIHTAQTAQPIAAAHRPNPGGNLRPEAVIRGWRLKGSEAPKTVNRLYESLRIKQSPF